MKLSYRSNEQRRRRDDGNADDDDDDLINSICGCLLYFHSSFVRTRWALVSFFLSLIPAHLLKFINSVSGTTDCLYICSCKYKWAMCKWRWTEKKTFRYIWNEFTHNKRKWLVKTERAINYGKNHMPNQCKHQNKIVCVEMKSNVHWNSIQFNTIQYD